MTFFCLQLYLNKVSVTIILNLPFMFITISYYFALVPAYQNVHNSPLVLVATQRGSNLELA